MPDVDKALRGEYEATLTAFVQKMGQIRDGAREDPLLRAQAIITILRCTPTVGDFSALRESLSRIDIPDQRAIIKECVLALASRLRDNTISPREGAKIAAAIEELTELLGYSR